VVEEGVTSVVEEGALRPSRNHAGRGWWRFLILIVLGAVVSRWRYVPTSASRLTVAWGARWGTTENTWNGFRKLFLWISRNVVERLLITRLIVGGA